ncbi:alpha/beta hydrolase [Lignipirellula cremea]|uniref:Acetylxylan esterase n=1 Tax=Lignipirellula cremea TaxID=2528010 RepID=A0A518DPW2_9BACT|nr:alpha/beta hydrolase [Lignipirellula cremea]QDU93863.1 Acetylxylan esterase precursor [Lignipirellula cremea]
MKISTTLPFVLLGLFGVSTLHGADEPEVKLTPGETAIRKHLSDDDYRITTIRLWPNEAPDEPRPIGEETVVKGERGDRIERVTQPSMTIARPTNAPTPTPAVIVCPGGGYGSLGIETGGVDVVQWLKEAGVAGVYLKYRVPKRHQGYAMHHHALQDIQRAVCLLRSRAQELQIDPDRIGVIGFSAGGNLAAMLSGNHGTMDRLYERIDKADEASCRPNFVAMVAPAYLTDPILSDNLVPELKLDTADRNQTPPTFIASATTDKFTVGSCHYLLALRDKRVSVELHLYERGGHAEGIHDGPDNQWPVMFKDWMLRKGLLGESHAEK